MKKLFVLSFLALPFVASAQFTKGNMFLGGSVSTLIQNNNPNASSFPTITNPSTQVSNFGLAPSVGFFINERIAVGTSLSYSTSTQKVDYSQYPQVTSYTSKSEFNSFGISPFIRYYLPIANSFYIGLQGGLSFSRSNTTMHQLNVTVATQSTLEIPTYSIGVNFRPTFIFFPSPRWGVEASIGSLGYSYTRNLPDAGSANSFGLSAGSLSFGIAYYFLKK